MENFKDVQKFFDYLIIEEDGWKGIREDAPDDVKQAYDEYVKKQKDLESEGIKA